MFYLAATRGCSHIVYVSEITVVINVLLAHLYEQLAQCKSAIYSLELQYLWRTIKFTNASTRGRPLTSIAPTFYAVMGRAWQLKKAGLNTQRCIRVDHDSPTGRLWPPRFQPRWPRSHDTRSSALTS